MTVVLTALPDGIYAPHVQVDVDDPPPEASTVTVWRTTNGRRMKVRGMIAVAADGASALDFEAGLNVELSYRAQFFDADGQFLGWSDPATVTLNVLTVPYLAWWHNPLDPSTSVRVELRGHDVRTLTRRVPGEVYNPAGRSVGVAIFTGPRSGYTGLVLDAVTLTAEDERVFDSLFGDYDDFTIPVVCIRTAPESRLPATLFALIPAPTKHIFDGAELGEMLHWDLVGDEVAAPAEALVFALLDYADFTAYYSALGTEDYDEFSSAYSDYTDAQRDYSIAETA